MHRRYHGTCADHILARLVFPAEAKAASTAFHFAANRSQPPFQALTTPIPVVNWKATIANKDSKHKLYSVVRGSRLLYGQLVSCVRMV